MLKNCSCYNTMDEEPIILDYSHRKLDEVPQEILDNGRMLEELYLDCNDIELLPKKLFSLPKLKILAVVDNNLCELSKFLGNLDCIESLNVSKNCISELPDSIKNCIQLLQLDASVNPIVKLPDGLFNLSTLTHLMLNETFLEYLPENIGNISQLKVLELRQNQLSVLPKSMQNLQQLKRLDIGNNKFADLPVTICHMTNLEELLADGNAIEEIPPVIGLLKNMILLDISMNKLESLPPEIEFMECLTDLYLSVNELLELPENIGFLSSLETLKLDENDLLFLPPSLGRLENLEELDVSTNNLEGLPRSMGKLARLKVLNLDNNCIKSLPDELGNCSSLSLLSLHSNNLVSVPESFGGLTNLQMINLSANMLNFLPITFLGLKTLKALWLCENQSKPIVPLERIFDEREKKEVISCCFLPQKTWDEDETEDHRGSGEENVSSANEDSVNNAGIQNNEAVRTRGSISQYLMNRSQSQDDHTSSPGNELEKVTPWYEQEFIESIEDNEVFSDEDRHLHVENTTEEESYHLNRLINKQGFDCRQSSVEDQDHSFKDSDAGGATQDDRNDDILLVDAEGSSHNEGNTSVIISELEYLNNLNITEESCDLTTSNEEAMRLRFNNKRNRNGNPSCTYEAFKPTRFNLYTNSDEPSWSTIKKDNSLESSSPTIKKKSVTGKLNPLIGARLARDESPPAVCYSDGSEKQKYTVTQKYEDKIRALQQQRQKERSRRRNHSSRGADNIDQTFSRAGNLDLTFSPDIHPPSYAEFYQYRSNPTATLPSPSVYFISDDGDSVAIQLNDFALGSSRVKNGEKKKKGKEKKQKACSPPVDRPNGFQQPHYLYNTENRPRKQNGILQNLVSHQRILQSFENGHYETSLESKANQGINSHRKNNDFDDKELKVTALKSNHINTIMCQHLKVRGKDARMKIIHLILGHR
ncbi:erbin-like [Dendronephthya gigantea]|uniref:erbin-like n=1 Tax=Dendronephthya gigantea TaxID=151771 RepID=UPI00106BCED9|nr:erbin-like [Dendronephthya gigantea]